MVSAKMTSSILLVIFIAMLSCTGAQIGIPQIISLLDSVNDTSSTMASILPHVVNSLKNQEAYQIQTLKNQESFQNQTSKLFSQLADTQAEMARTLNHVALILQGKLLNT